MNKVPRFVTEYANYQKKFAETLPNKEHTEKAIKVIENAVRNLEKGLITVSEAMDGITHCFTD